jgi:hypothetical protein
LLPRSAFVVLRFLWQLSQAIRFLGRAPSRRKPLLLRSSALRGSGGSGCLRFLNGVGLAICRANPGTRSAADAGALIIHHHDLLLDLVVLVIIEINELALFIQSLKDHDVTAAHFEAAAAADAFLRINADQIIRIPSAAVAGYI